MPLWLALLSMANHTMLDDTYLSAAHIVDHHSEALSNITSFVPVVRLERAGKVRFVA
jgi:hypothetical protein